VATGIGAPIAAGLVLAASLGVGFACVCDALKQKEEHDEIHDGLVALYHKFGSLERMLGALLDANTKEIRALRDRLDTAVLESLREVIRSGEDKIIEALEKHEGLMVSLGVYLQSEFETISKAIGRLEIGQAEILDALDEIRPRPRLEIPGLGESAANEFLYSARRVAMLGRDEQMVELGAFLAHEDPFRWWLWTGPGGIGKSRLALELVLQNLARWDAGFIPLANTPANTVWEGWRPTRPTLVVIDYLALRAEPVRRAIETLQGRALANNLGHPVRFLLLEREAGGRSGADGVGGAMRAGVDPPWWSEFDDRTSNESREKRLAARHAEAREMPALTEDAAWDVMGEILRGLKPGAALPDRAGTIAAMREIDARFRPLYLAFAAHAIAAHGNIRGWDQQRLAEFVLERERARWEEVGVDRGYKRLLFLATLVGGLDLGDMNGRALADAAAETGLTPEPGALDLGVYASLAGVSPGTDGAKTLGGLEPDILGELFLLETLAAERDASATADDTDGQRLLTLGWRHTPAKVAVTLSRAAMDFVGHRALETLYREPEDADARVAWAGAVVDRGVARGRSGDEKGAIEDCTTVIEMEGALTALVARAFFIRGAVRGESGDDEGAIEDYTAAIELEGAPAEEVAWAYVIRGAARGRSGDHEGAIEDYTAAIEMEGAHPVLVALAYVYRGLVRGESGDGKGTIADCTAAIELEGAPAELVAKAYVNRGFARGESGDFAGAIEDCTALIEMEGAPAKQVAQAYVTRGAARGESGDYEGAIEDCTTAIELEGAQAELVAKAYVTRGAVRGESGDDEGAIEDCTTVIDREGAPLYEVARAHTTRGATRAKSGDHEGAIEDYTAAIEMEGAPKKHVVMAYVNRSFARGQSGDHEGAIADCTAAIELEGVPLDDVARAYVNRGEERRQSGDDKGAIADCTAAIELEGAPAEQVARAYFLRGGVAAGAGDMASACRDWRAAAVLLALPAELQDLVEGWIREHCAGCG